MQKPWQKLVVGLAVGVASAAIILGPVLVFGDSYGLDATAKAAKIPNNGSVQQIIGNVIGTALSMISVLFFALMLYAGIKWMLARGDSDEAKKALDTIVAAIIGMLVVLGSYAITTFVFGTLGQQDTGPSVTGGSCKADPLAVSTCAGIKLEAECTEAQNVSDWECAWNAETNECYTKAIGLCPTVSDVDCKSSAQANPAYSNCYWE